jgi:hypothetical protein
MNRASLRACALASIVSVLGCLGSTEDGSDAATHDAAAVPTGSDGHAEDAAVDVDDATAADAGATISADAAAASDAASFDADILPVCPNPPPQGKCDVPGKPLCGVGCTLDCVCGPDGMVRCVAPPCPPP